MGDEITDTLPFWDVRRSGEASEMTLIKGKYTLWDEFGMDPGEQMCVIV